MSPTDDVAALAQIEDPLKRIQAAWDLVEEMVRATKLARIDFARTGQSILGTTAPDGQRITRDYLARMLGISPSTVACNVKMTALNPGDENRVQGFYGKPKRDHKTGRKT